MSASEAEPGAEPSRIDRVYDSILAQGDAGREAYYAGLRRAGIAATPADEAGQLYAPNPVLVPRSLVDRMRRDLDSFLRWRLEDLRDADDLLAASPPLIREQFADRELAQRLFEGLQRRHPLACLDAYLVETEEGLDRAYLEWQTAPGYYGVGLASLEASAAAFPQALDQSAALFAEQGWDAADVRRLLRELLVCEGADARSSVLIDVEPESQETRREFFALQALTGGSAEGIGIVDPRALFYDESRLSYRRDGKTIPVTRIMSRLVHDDIVQRLLPILNVEERETLARVFRDLNVDWLVHPLHFFYGSKRDFPAFRERGGSAVGLPPCELVDEELIESLKREGRARMEGRVQKPVEGSGGAAVIAEPRLEDLCPGSLLQDMIKPASCHRTLAGRREPELRIMGIPRADGGIATPIVFSRVKAPREFRSNAGVTARAEVAGTGEGYAWIVDDGDGDR